MAGTALKGNFARVMGLTLGFEGVYTVDNGGPTKYGVTIPFLADAWLRAGRQATPTATDIKSLKRSEAEAAYRTLLWDRLRCDELPLGVDYAVFDAAVNSGAFQAAKWLQRASGTRPDGIVGTATLAAAKVRDPEVLVVELNRLRAALMLHHPDEEIYEVGWITRLLGVTAGAVKMIYAG